MLEDLLDVKNSKMVALTLLVLVLVPLLFWIIFSRNTKRKPFLNPEVWQELPLVEKEVVTHNTRRFRFGLPYKDQPIGLPIGQHISIKALKPAADGSEIMKPYTPISDDDLLGYVDFVIKVYDHGRMSQHMDELAIGDKLLFKGPRGRFKYSRNQKRALGMIAGGTGITPMYQVAMKLLKDPEDTTQMSLIFGNVLEDDILIREELNALTAAHPKRFKVYHVLNNAPPGWTQGVGFITANIIEQHLEPPAEDVLVLRCGPGPMNAAVKRALDSLGYTREMQFEF